MGNEDSKKTFLKSKWALPSTLTCSSSSGWEFSLVICKRGKEYEKAEIELCVTILRRKRSFILFNWLYLLRISRTRTKKKKRSNLPLKLRWQRWLVASPRTMLYPLLEHSFNFIWRCSVHISRIAFPYHSLKGRLWIVSRSHCVDFKSLCGPLAQSAKSESLVTPCFSFPFNPESWLVFILCSWWWHPCPIGSGTRFTQLIIFLLAKHKF